jgi:methylthioribulose-1-phosphate dehydratase
MTLMNPFPSPTTFEEVLLQELSVVAKRCYERGWSWGTAGNFSIRGQHGLIWQSPTGLCKGDLDVKLYVPVHLETEKTVDPWSTKPSAEMPVHAGIYKHDSSARCVVHTHPPRAVALSMDVDQFRFSNQEMIKALGFVSHKECCEIPILENPDPEAMKNYSSKVGLGMCPPAKLVVLKGHGVYAYGKTPLEALAYLEALEFLCEHHRGHPRG